MHRIITVNALLEDSPFQWRILASYNLLHRHPLVPEIQKMFPHEVEVSHFSQLLSYGRGQNFHQLIVFEVILNSEIISINICVSDIGITFGQAGHSVPLLRCSQMLCRCLNSFLAYLFHKLNTYAAQM